MSLPEKVDEVVSLLGDTAEQLGKLIQNEARLARAELTEKVTNAGLGIGYLIGAAVLCVPVIVMLLLAIAAGLVSAGFSAVASYLIAAGVGAGVAAVLGAIGMQHLKPKNLTPSVTMEQVNRDVATAKELAG